MSFDQTKVPAQRESQKEESGGLTMSPPAFSLAASGAGAPVQRQTVEGEQTAAVATGVTLNATQITAARSHNVFLLGEAAGVNALQAALGVDATGTFDDATLNAIATYQTQNQMAHVDGRLDQGTLDRLVRALVTAGNHNSAAAIARDFFQLDMQATPIAVQYVPELTENATMTQNDQQQPVLQLGPGSFANGLTSLGEALDSAMGAGASIANQSWDLMFAGTNNERQNAMWSNPNADNEAGLAVWVRQNFPTEEDLQAYMGRQDVTQAEKVATLGLLSAELGRLEFLMGVLYYGGTDRSWETGGANRGAFVNHYKSEVGNGVNDAPWCTMFSGYLRRMLGFSEELSTRGPLIFNAGLRLDRWATDGTNLLTGRDDFDDPTDYANYSGGSIDTDEWVTLRTALNRAGITADQRRQEVADFFAARITPQPGDIMVINTGSTTNQYRNRSQSHTVNVESYSGTTVSTIEGNRGDKVTGVTLDLSNPAHAGQVLILARLGAEFFPEAPAPAPAAEGEQAAEVPAADQVTADSLMQPLTAMTRQLQLLAHRREYISSNAAGATVATMAGPNNTGGDL